jgi:hypothetical protein
MIFIGAGVFAFSRLNIEAYPNPAPVILEITAQSPGLSAETIAATPCHASDHLERLRASLPPGRWQGAGDQCGSEMVAKR